MSAEKNLENQVTVPEDWRPILVAMVRSFCSGNFRLTDVHSAVTELSEKDAELIRQNIENYGCQLVELPAATWESSVCQWYGEYWDVIVDLYTEEEGRSDQIMSVRVTEIGVAHQFDVHLVYVP